MKYAQILIKKKKDIRLRFSANYPSTSVETKPVLSPELVELAQGMFGIRVPDFSPMVFLASYGIRRMSPATEPGESITISSRRPCRWIACGNYSCRQSVLGDIPSTHTHDWSLPMNPYSPIYCLQLEREAGRLSPKKYRYHYGGRESFADSTIF